MITGGAGFIGSHTVVEFLTKGCNTLILDNLSNSSSVAIERVKIITQKNLIFIQGDVNDRALLNKIFIEYPIDAVIHLAGLKAVGESVDHPLDYYQNNVAGTLTLLAAMQTAKIKTIIFSSSATVYGKPKQVKFVETLPTGQPESPYGQSKLMIEIILKNLCQADSEWSVGILRYFNPIGAHTSGLIGEDPSGVPNNLVPNIAQLAVGRLKKVFVYGGDYKTHDGTGIRDYIHVMDLADGHFKAYHYIREKKGVFTWNLGSGKGYSVLEIINTFSKVSGINLPYEIIERRDGDIPEYWADPTKAHLDLDWKAKKGLETMIRDTWRWQCNNPHGFSNN